MSVRFPRALEMMDPTPFNDVITLGFLSTLRFSFFFWFTLFYAACLRFYRLFGSPSPIIAACLFSHAASYAAIGFIPLRLFYENRSTLIRLWSVPFHTIRRCFHAFSLSPQGCCLSRIFQSHVSLMVLLLVYADMLIIEVSEINLLPRCHADNAMVAIFSCVFFFHFFLFHYDQLSTPNLHRYPPRPTPSHRSPHARPDQARYRLHVFHRHAFIVWFSPDIIFCAHLAFNIFHCLRRHFSVLLVFIFSRAITAPRFVLMHFIFISSVFIRQTHAIVSYAVSFHRLYYNHITPYAIVFQRTGLLLSFRSPPSVIHTTLSFIFAFIRPPIEGYRRQLVLFTSFQDSDAAIWWIFILTHHTPRSLLTRLPLSTIASCSTPLLRHFMLFSVLLEHGFATRPLIFARLLLFTSVCLLTIYYALSFACFVFFTILCSINRPILSMPYWWHCHAIPSGVSFFSFISCHVAVCRHFQSATPHIWLFVPRRSSHTSFYHAFYYSPSLRLQAGIAAIVFVCHWLALSIFCFIPYLRFFFVTLHAPLLFIVVFAFISFHGTL